MKKFLIPALFTSLILAACGTSTDVTVGTNKPLEVQSFNAVMGTKNLVDPVHGKETRFAYGAVLGVNGTKANGISYLHTFADGTSVLTVNLNILPVSGKHVVAWMTDETGTSVTYVGELTSVMNDARHAVILETKEDVKNIHTIVVTLEDSQQPTMPSVHRAEGTLKVVKN